MNIGDNGGMMAGWEKSKVLKEEHISSKPITQVLEKQPETVCNNIFATPYMETMFLATI